MEPAPLSLPFRVSALPGKKPTRFELAPDAAARAALAAWLGILELPSARLTGTLSPRGRADWVLEADLTAQVVQACVVSLEPVETVIDEPVLRRYLADMAQPDADEVEMPEDDSAEPLPPVIDVGAVMAEALSLALPLYPRAAGADSLPEQEAEAETRRPFAGLAALMSKRGDEE